MSVIAYFVLYKFKILPNELLHMDSKEKVSIIASILIYMEEIKKRK